MKRPLRAALCAALVLGLAEAAWARVGGGQSYGGGGSSGSGGDGGGGGGFLIYLLIRLIFEYPAVGIPLAIVAAVVFFAMNARSAQQLQGNLSTQQARDWSARATPTRRGGSPVEALRRVDANFSTPLFLDFVNLLYTRLQTERTGDLAGLAGYLAPDLRSRLCDETRAAGTREVRDVVVGSIRITDLSLGERQVLDVDLETNFTEVGAGGASPVYSVERWSFGRRAGVLSKGPEEITKFACPSCGSPAEFRPDGSCPYCGEVPAGGAFAWVLQGLQVRNRMPRPKMDLRQGGEEVGTDDFTKMQPDFELRRKEFMVRHPDFSWPEFEKRGRYVFMALQQAWSQGKWELARPFETDHLFATHRYWMEAYAREGLANRVEDVQIDHLVPVKIETDAYFDALTVRIWASSRDWTEEVATKREVGGSRDRARKFTEYWTFLRRSGFQGKGAEDPSRCPSCGAPLEIGMAGVCPYCETKITTGEFDWTLSLIEQDEAYEA